MEFVILTASVSAVIKLAMDELYSFNKRHALQITKAGEKLRQLYTTYVEISNMVENVDCWQCQKDNTALEAEWLDDLVMYCYDTEDLIEDITLGRPVSNFGREIGELQKKLEGLGSQFKTILSERKNNSSGNSRVPSVSSYQSLLSDTTPLVCGTSRDRDKKAIIEELTSLKPRPFGVSILGMDGLGKTSLARAIKDDETITNHFDLVLSATVSNDFHMEDIVDKLVADHLEASSETAGPDRNRRILKKLISGKRALVILDDLWSVADKDWESFRCEYLLSSSSWKILSTTRNPDVAEVTQSTAHYLDRMTNEDCTKLIMEKVYQLSHGFQISLEDAGAIAEKCNGMPILADKFALTLSRKSGGEKIVEKMRKLKTTALWELPEFKEVFPSLKLNEQNLPSHLKRCFAYFSLFSPNYKFIREDLIKLWEVEGLVRESQQAGCQCFDDLLSRSILQPLDSSNQKPLSYKMPDIIFKFAQLLASKAFLQIDKDTTDLLPLHKYIRHLSLTCEDIDESLLNQIKECKGLRTFLLPHQSKPKRRNISSTFFRELYKLRLLDLSYTNLSQLLDPATTLKYPSKKISPFKHLQRLRYLDLSGTDIQELPEPINPLQALQVLKLENCLNLDRLPDDLIKLVRLTHLHVNLKRLGCLPPNLRRLANLRVLISYRVRNKEGHKVAELSTMRHLREVCISRLENVNGKEEAKQSMLRLKPMLRRLVLEWENPYAEMGNAREVLEGLEPHNDLTDLTVRNYKCQRFPTWLSSPSKKLVSIYLHKCQDCRVLPSLGELPHLETLVLHSIENVEIVDRRFYGQGEGQAFRSLETLEFRDMERLVYWIGLEAGDMPCLDALKIIDCPKLIYLPSLQHHDSLVNLEIANCRKLRSLPELSSSFKGEHRKLIIADCPLVEERCQIGGADWEKIKDVTNKKIIPNHRTSIKPITLPIKNHQVAVNSTEDEPSSSQVQPAITEQKKKSSWFIFW